jgi:hypothetical protein
MTKLLGTKRLEHLFEKQEFREVLSPLVEPESPAVAKAINQYLKELDCYSERPTSNTKMAVLLSSFIMQAQRLKGRVERKGGEMIIGYPHDEVYWRKRSSVGYDVAKKLRLALVKHGWMTHRADATINLYEGDGSCNGYLISDFVPDLTDGLQFQSTDLVYAASTSTSSKKLNAPEVDERVKALWERWKAHPLVLDGQTMFTASRRFNNNELTRGGRFYGPWTTIPQVRRLEGTIDGQPVAEVDVSGMNLTLLCSISGHIPFKTRFKDAYECEWPNRAEVKAIINETIGAGHPRHYQPGKLCREAGLMQAQFTHIRKNYIAPKFECLKILKKGELDSLTLAFHESEIMMRVVERLRIPVFILHDCLICQRSFELEVGKELQYIYINYCQEQGWKPVAPAFSVARSGKDEVRYSGYRI